MDNIKCIRCLFGLHAMIIMIYVNCLYYLGYHVRNKQKENTRSGTFAVCKNHGTRQTCQYLPCAKTMAHGKDLNFAVCHASRAHGKGAATSSWLATLFCRGSRMAHGKPFAVCPIYSTRQRPALPIPGCRVRFAVCGTRQRICRGLLGLYRVPLAHGKGGVSRSESIKFVNKIMIKITIYDVVVSFSKLRPSVLF